jgi:hypothetical protein
MLTFTRNEYISIYITYEYMKCVCVYVCVFVCVCVCTLTLMRNRQLRGGRVAEGGVGRVCLGMEQFIYVVFGL